METAIRETKEQYWKDENDWRQRDNAFGNCEALPPPPPERQIEHKQLFDERKALNVRYQDIGEYENKVKEMGDKIEREIFEMEKLMIRWYFADYDRRMKYKENRRLNQEAVQSCPDCIARGTLRKLPVSTRQ
jgi:type I restriction-modification system DNA methylase subunit